MHAQADKQIKKLTAFFPLPFYFKFYHTSVGLPCVPPSLASTGAALHTSAGVYIFRRVLHLLPGGVQVSPGDRPALSQGQIPSFWHGDACTPLFLAFSVFWLLSFRAQRLFWIAGNRLLPQKWDWSVVTCGLLREECTPAQRKSSVTDIGQSSTETTTNQDTIKPTPTVSPPFTSTSMPPPPPAPGPVPR